MNNDWREYYDPEYILMHHGIKGQKWGVRQYQNPDGTLTAAGKARYGSASGKVEKYARKSASWEGRAINAKTRIGMDFSTGMAQLRRQKADKVAAKATGDYKALALNKNTARNYASAAETNANIAAGLKKRADNTSNGAKREYLMDRAVKNLANAGTAETFSMKYNAVANAKVGKKTATLIKKSLSETTYTPAGRKSTIKDKAIEAFGDAIISQAMKSGGDKLKDRIDSNPNNSYEKAEKLKKGVDVAQRIASKGVVSKGRDVAYRVQNKADKRWKKIMDD